MRRIAHVISSPVGVGGAERVLAALVAGGAARGWEQVVLNPFAGVDRNEELAALCSSADYRDHRCDRLKALAGTRRWLNDQLNELAPSLVHSHLFYALVAVSSLRRRGGNIAPSIVSHHHGDLLRQSGRPVLAALDRRAGRRFDRVVAVSASSRRFLVQTCGYAPARVEYIRNGWSGAPLERQRAARAPTVICVANMRAPKRHDVLLAAFHQVVARLPGAQLVLVGDGDLRPQVEADICRRGLQESVLLTGSVKDVWPLLSDADVFAVASDYETFGISLVEAMAAGLPIVATAVGGLAELVQEGVTGNLVAAGDASAMADRLCTLLRSPDAAVAAGSAGAVAAQAYTAERMVDTYFALYDRLLEGPGGR